MNGLGMKLQDHLSLLASRLRQPDLRLNDAGVCRLVLDQQLGVTIESLQQGETAILYSVLGTFPDRGKEALFEKLLSAQLFSRDVGEGCSFGIDPQSQEILLQRKLGLEHLSGDDFYSALNEFVNWAEYWQQKLHGTETAPDQSLSDSSHVFRV